MHEEVKKTGQQKEEDDPYENYEYCILLHAAKGIDFNPIDENDQNEIDKHKIIVTVALNDTVMICIGLMKETLTSFHSNCIFASDLSDIQTFTEDNEKIIIEVFLETEQSEDINAVSERERIGGLQLHTREMPSMLDIHPRKRLMMQWYPLTDLTIGWRTRKPQLLLAFCITKQAYGLNDNIEKILNQTLIPAFEVYPISSETADLLQTENGGLEVMVNPTSHTIDLGNDPKQCANLFKASFIFTYIENLDTLLYCTHVTDIQFHFDLYGLIHEVCLLLGNEDKYTLQEKFEVQYKATFSDLIDYMKHNFVMPLALVANGKQLVARRFLLSNLLPKESNFFDTHNSHLVTGSMRFNRIFKKMHSNFTAPILHFWFKLEKITQPASAVDPGVICTKLILKEYPSPVAYDAECMHKDDDGTYVFKGDPKINYESATEYPSRANLLGQQDDINRIIDSYCGAVKFSFVIPLKLYGPVRLPSCDGTKRGRSSSKSVNLDQTGNTSGEHPKQKLSDQPQNSSLQVQNHIDVIQRKDVQLKIKSRAQSNTSPKQEQSALKPAADVQLKTELCTQKSAYPLRRQSIVEPADEVRVKPKSRAQDSSYPMEHHSDVTEGNDVQMKTKSHAQNNASPIQEQSAVQPIADAQLKTELHVQSSIVEPTDYVLTHPVEHQCALTTATDVHLKTELCAQNSTRLLHPQVTVVSVDVLQAKHKSRTQNSSSKVEDQSSLGAANDVYLKTKLHSQINTPPIPAQSALKPAADVQLKTELCAQNNTHLCNQQSIMEPGDFLQVERKSRARNTSHPVQNKSSVTQENNARLKTKPLARHDAFKTCSAPLEQKQTSTQHKSIPSIQESNKTTTEIKEKANEDVLPPSQETSTHNPYGVKLADPVLTRLDCLRVTTATERKKTCNPNKFRIRPQVTSARKNRAPLPKLNTSPKHAKQNDSSTPYTKANPCIDGSEKKVGTEEISYLSSSNQQLLNPTQQSLVDTELYSSKHCKCNPTMVSIAVGTATPFRPSATPGYENILEGLKKWQQMQIICVNKLLSYSTDASLNRCDRLNCTQDELISAVRRCKELNEKMRDEFLKLNLNCTQAEVKEIYEELVEERKQANQKLTSIDQEIKILIPSYKQYDVDRLSVPEQRHQIPKKWLLPINAEVQVELNNKVEAKGKPHQPKSEIIQEKREVLEKISKIHKQWQDIVADDPASPEMIELLKTLYERGLNVLNSAITPHQLQGSHENNHTFEKNKVKKRVTFKLPEEEETP